MMKWYTVYWIGGDLDGSTISKFSSEHEAIKFARTFYKDHEMEFDSVWGGLGIRDPYGEPVEW